MTAKADTAGKAEEAEGRRSLVETWTEVVADASGLVQAEAGLARAETAANLRAMLRGSIIILAGLVLCMVAITFLSVAAVVGLAALIGLGWALLAVATVSIVLGVLLVRNGQVRMESLKILPDQSFRRISADLQRLSARGRAMRTSPAPAEPGPADSAPAEPGPVDKGERHETP